MRLIFLYYDNGDYDPVYTGDQIKEAIKLGAHWAIDEFLKGLWHDASEKPENKALLVKFKNGLYRVTSYSFLVKEEGEKWCYLGDLFPEKEVRNEV